MDRNTAREILLTRYKPVKKEIATPYMPELDGHIMLVGLSASQRLDLEQNCMDEIKNPDGSTTSKLNRKKYEALAMQACVRLRGTEENVLSLPDVLGENSDGTGEFMQMDGGAPFKDLEKEVLALIGSKSTTELKKSSEPTQSGSATSSQPPDSTEPSQNSSTELTQEN